MSAILGAALFALGWGGINREIGSFERIAAADIAQLLEGDNKSVVVKTKLNGPFGGVFADLYKGRIIAKDFNTNGLPLFADATYQRTGFIRFLEIELSNFSMNGLHIESLNSSIPNCWFDRDLAIKKKQIRLSRSGVGTGAVVITQEALQEYIPLTVPEIKRCTVKLEKNKVWVEGFGEFLIAKTEFWLVADLVPVDLYKLELRNARVNFGWKRVDGIAAQTLLDALNPVVDLQKDLGLFDTFAVTKITTKNGKLQAEGITRIPDIAQKKKPAKP